MKRTAREIVVAALLMCALILFVASLVYAARSGCAGELKNVTIGGADLARDHFESAIRFLIIAVCTALVATYALRGRLAARRRTLLAWTLGVLLVSLTAVIPGIANLAHDTCFGRT